MFSCEWNNQNVLLIRVSSKERPHNIFGESYIISFLGCLTKSLLVTLSKCINIHTLLRLGFVPGLFFYSSLLFLLLFLPLLVRTSLYHNSISCWFDDALSPLTLFLTSVWRPSLSSSQSCSCLDSLPSSQAGQSPVSTSIWDPQSRMCLTSNCGSLQPGLICL